MASRAFESAERRLKPSQRKLTYANPSLVIVEVLMPNYYHAPTYYVQTREEADGIATRTVKRGGSVLIHHREGTVTITPNAEREGTVT